MNLNKLLYIAGGVALVVLIAFFVWWNSRDVIIDNDNNIPGNTIIPGIVNKSALTGEGCENFARRPVAVMIAGDPITRPLSGIGEADIVFEMPVTPGGITRLMAVYQCSSPREIGSVRSAREDFIPLAGSFRAIYAHWGGEHDALKKLDSGILNNVDALKYEGTAFFRKPRIAAPHNGFTNLDLIFNTADTLGYKTENEFEGYPHSEIEPEKDQSSMIQNIDIPYPSPFYVRWTYDAATNQYKRTRGGQPEIDRNSGSQIASSVIIVMSTKWHYYRDQYIRVDVQGQGDVKIYQGGRMIAGTWKRGNAIDSKLYFYDLEGKEIPFVSGKMWVEIVASI